MLTLTDSAQKAIGRFIKGSDSPVAGLRIAVTGEVVRACSTACPWKSP